MDSHPEDKGKPKAGDRKNAHLSLAASPLAQSGRGAGFARVQLEHSALPECDLGSIDTSTNTSTNNSTNKCT